MDRASSRTKWLVSLIGSVALLLWPSPSHWSETGFAASLPARAPPSSGPLHTAKTMTPGITLTLTVPRDAYARNALARITLKLENVSPYDVAVPNNLCVPEMRVPFAEAVTSGGKTVFPFELPTPPAIGSPCMTSPQTQLPRGSAITRHEYVIVRSARLRGVGAFIHIPGPGPSSGPDEFWLYTPPVHVALLRGHAPRVTLVDSPTVRASVHSGGRGRQPRCTTRIGTDVLRVEEYRRDIGAAGSRLRGTMCLLRGVMILWSGTRRWRH